MSKGDLVYSAIAARWPEGLETIERFRAELDSRNFALDREAVLRLTGLLAGVGAHAIKLIGNQVTGDHLKEAWSRTEDALRRGVDFLIADCNVPRASCSALRMSRSCHRSCSISAKVISANWRRFS